jgi:glycine C-acetyltransferase
VAAACLAAFRILEEEPQRVERLWSNTRYFKKQLVEGGLDTGMSETPIVPVMVGEAAEAHEYSRRLFAAGLLATGIGFPTVPKGRARVRTIVTSEHTHDHLDQSVKLLIGTAKAMGFTR